MPSDEQLTAFIDGELEAAEHDRIERLIESDAKVAERFDLLLRSDLPFHEAFEPLLAAAPGAKLDAMLAAIPPPMQRRMPRPASAAVASWVQLPLAWSWASPSTAL